jgi:hypothetical protein
LGAPKLTVEQLDARHAEKRAALQARHEEAEKAKAERKAKKGGKAKFEALARYLERNELILAAEGEIDVHWGQEFVGTLYEVSTEPTE